MTGACVEMLSLDGSRVQLHPGDLIGRSWRAELSIVDPSVSEFHACVSLRNGQIRLRRLGGPLSIHGMSATEVTVEEGLVIALSPDVSLTVVQVTLPRGLGALIVDDQPPQPLVGTRHGLSPDGRLLPTPEPAGAVVWTDGDTWLLSDGGEVWPLDEGETHWKGHRLQLVEVSVEAGDVAPTRRLERYTPLSITARYSTVQVHQEGLPVVILSGQPARLLTEVAQLGPASWDVVAAELWPRLKNRDALRKRWDRVLSRLRHKLKAEQIRPDLVRSTGGQVELVVMPGDKLELLD